MCLSILWLWWESVQRAMIANNVRMFFAFKGHPHLLEDLKWVLFLGNPRQLNVLSETILVPPPPLRQLLWMLYGVCSLLLLTCKCAHVNWSWWLENMDWACGVLCRSTWKQSSPVSSGCRKEGWRFLCLLATHENAVWCSSVSCAWMLFIRVVNVGNS